MPRPKTKEELLIAANEQFEKMQKLIQTFPNPGEVMFNFDDPILKEAHWKRDKNIRDIFIHLYEWHILLLDWVQANRNGENRHFLPEPYNWKTYGDMNVKLWKKHQTTSCNNAEKMLQESHNKIISLIESLSNEELFEKKHFSWTDGLGSYFVSVTSSHYNWAIKKIKQYMKSEK